MRQVPHELRDEIPSFDEGSTHHDQGSGDWSGLTSVRGAKSALEIGTVIAIAIGVFFGLEAILRLTDTPTYVSRSQPQSSVPSRMTSGSSTDTISG